MWGTDLKRKKKNIFGDLGIFKFKWKKLLNFEKIRIFKLGFKLLHSEEISH